MIKKIIIAVLIITLVGGYMGYKIYHKPHLNVAQARTIENLNADDLLNAFKNNEAEASTKYINKVIGVSGKISTVKNEGNQITIQLETSDMLSNIICNLDSALISNKIHFKEGDSTRIKGICSGYLSDVILDRCVVAN